MHLDIKPLKLVTIITAREKGRKLVAILNENGFDFHDSFLGYGTAPTEIAAYLGLGESEKAIVLLCLDGNSVKELFTLLKNEEYFEDSGGLAFTVPINSVSNLEVVKLLTGLKIGG